MTFTARVRRVGSASGSARTGHAWTTWIGYGGRRVSSAANAGILAAEQRKHQVRWMQPPHVGDFRDDLRQDADPTDGVVHGRLAIRAKDGVSAQSLQRTLEFGSYQTAWAILHRLRSVLVRPGRERLSGRVEVDKTFIGGVEPGLQGGRQRGKKLLVVVPVEVHEPKGFGRCRMRIIPDASA